MLGVKLKRVAFTESSITFLPQPRRKRFSDESSEITISFSQKSKLQSTVATLQVRNGNCHRNTLNEEL